ncbi:MAG: type I pantothenate kinase [Alphaproteobacteria bacterium]
MSPVHALAADLAARRPSTGPLIVGLTGAVAAGKSTLAGELKTVLADQAKVEIIATDGFLRPNAELTELGLLEQKGFPPTYDNDRFRAALTDIRTGPAIFPTYSHTAYDIDPALARTLSPPDILIVEGLNLQHRSVAPEAADPLDLLIYLDADEADLESWYVARFLELWEEAEHDPTSFYARFRSMSRGQTEDLARMVWTGVNLKNLRENIILARDTADLVVRKAADHAIVEVVRR